MILKEILFFTFSALLLVGAFLVVSSWNPVRAALSLVLSFFSASFLWMLLESEFLAIILILVYVGAVMVLFLFVVMMLNIRFDALKDRLVCYWPLALLCVGVFVFQLCWVLGWDHLSKVFPQEAFPYSADFNSINELGQLLFTQYVYPVEIAAVILLAAIVAAIGLTFRGPRARLVQSSRHQLSADKASRLRLEKGIAPP